MKVVKTDIPDVLIIEPTVFEDERGYFFEGFNKNKFNELVGLEVNFVQDNYSLSKHNVLRGLHYQIKQSQGKLVSVLSGEIFDVAVDLRKLSKTFGKWVGVHVSSENKKRVWIPQGFAHGFFVTSETAEVEYKTTDYYAPEFERCIRWDDPELNINWRNSGKPTVSQKDSEGALFSQAELFG